MGQLLHRDTTRLAQVWFLVADGLARHKQG
jgi:hypothetical protein